MPTKMVGRTEPRLWTRPLRELTRETSLGFEVIDFARDILGVNLYEWQQWLLIHALEILEDGRYRFKQVVVLVARQNGKTTLASVLAAWWLFVDSARHKDRIPPLKFKVVGVAQNLDIASEPWEAVKVWCDPNPETEEDRDLAIPSLQKATSKVRDTNGKVAIVALSRAHYEVRAAKSARGKPAARVIFDELREQKDWYAWNAVSQTKKAFFSGMLIAFSNAGAPDSVVLRQQRNGALLALRATGVRFDDYVDVGVEAAEAYANGEDDEDGPDPELVADDDSALFEWSARPGCRKDDVEGILQANPSIGYGEITVRSVLSEIRKMTDAGYRTEVLCQWVSAQVNTYIDVKEWEPLHVAPELLKIRRGARTVWGVDTSADRQFSWVAAAVLTESGHPFVTVRVKRAGMLWVPDYLTELAKDSGQSEVVLQSRGCPAMEFVESLTDRGLTVHPLEGSYFALATGRFADRVRDRELVVVDQPDVDLAVEGAVVMKYAENWAWSRQGSMPIDISGLVAESLALYGLELLKPADRPAIPAPPPQAEMVFRDDVAPTDTNLLSAHF